MFVRRGLVPFVVGCGLVLAACGGRGLSRDEVRDGYVKYLVDNGLDQRVAECMVDGFVDPLSDDELRAFNTEGTKLTEQEAARFEQLEAQCLAG